MLNELISGIVRSFVQPWIDLAKTNAVIYYIEGIKIVRNTALAVCALIFCTTLAVAGLLLLPLGLCLYMPWTPETKAIVIVAFALLYLGVGITVGAILFSEKRWMKMTGASRMLEKL
ncbi:MAG: hypothetical protein SGI97_09690 [candidate division Zixibacteria bacterium]|nr:hypothetical protein [candidate division Zixibacteria bacterium]